MNIRQNKSHSQVLLVALLAFMPAATSFGKTDQTSPSKAKSAGQNTKSGKRVVEAGEAVVRDSSEYYREEKKAMLPLSFLVQILFLLDLTGSWEVFI